MKVAVIGCGHWGRNLVRVFHEIGVLGAVCDVRANVLVNIETRYPGVRVVSDPERVLRDPNIEAVAIATPAASHYRLARRALEAGKHVLVEKPLALHSGDAEELVVHAETEKRTLMVGHLLRYHPAIIKLKALCTQGDLGRLEYVYSNRLHLGRVRREENALWSFAPHDLSVILHLFESMPRQVTAVGGAYLQPTIADVSVSNLLFDNGARAHIFVSWLHPFKEQKLVVVGAKQMAVFDDVGAPTELMLYEKGIELVGDDFLAHRRAGRSVPVAAAEPLRNECEHFVACVQERATPHTDGHEGLRVLQVLHACQQSLQRNGEPVDVAESNNESRYGQTEERLHS